MELYYVDTAIWIDLYEDREGYMNEPLGYFALNLLSLIKMKHRLLISDLLLRELESFYSIPEINGMINPFEKIITKVQVSPKQKNEAQLIFTTRKLPKGDILHAIVARDMNAILITRDKHFQQLRDICSYYKPEDLI